MNSAASGIRTVSAAAGGTGAVAGSDGNAERWLSNSAGSRQAGRIYAVGEGFPIGEQRSKDVPPELLEEVFELNMMLEELRAGDESAKPQLETAKQNFIRDARGDDQELETLFAQHDQWTPKQRWRNSRRFESRRYMEN